MSIELGHFALCAAFALALLQGASLGFRKSAVECQLVCRAAWLQGAFLAFSFVTLVYAFIVSDFSLGIVVANSHTSKPLLYKIAGTWGNHEGSILLWVVVLSLYGGLLALQASFSKRDDLQPALAILGGVNALFIGYLLILSNPFERVTPPPMNGEGFNPLLQDPGLAFHPTTLYLGYVGCAVPFALTLGYLIRPYDLNLWVLEMRRWVLGPWLFLTLGIVLGSYWAYYELGWGGWWFWDPVENASFMPWLILTALLHTLAVVRKTGALLRTSCFLALLAYWLSVGGTFLVRSGFVSSIHTFAVDPYRGMALLAMVAGIMALSGGVMLFTFYRLKPTPLTWFSREGALSLNSYLLTLAMGVVLIGTLAPMIALQFFDVAFSLNADYFNATFIPLMVPLLVLMGIGPWLRWSRAQWKDLYPTLLRATLVGLGGILVISFYTRSGTLGTYAGLFLAFWLLSHTLYLWLCRLQKEGLRSLDVSFHGMTVAHMGTAVMVIGMITSSTWEQEKLLWMHPAGSTDLAGYTFTLRTYKVSQGSNYQGVQGVLDVYQGKKFITTLLPERRLYGVEQMASSEVSLYSTGLSDLYSTLGQVSSDGQSYEMHLRYNPGIALLWYGGFLIGLGALFCLFPRRRP